MFSILFSENRAVYEIMWKNVQLARQQMTIWRTRIACCIPVATNTHLAYVILLLFHSSSSCTNSPHCYVMRTLPVLLIFMLFYYQPTPTPPLPPTNTHTCVGNTHARAKEG